MDVNPVQDLDSPNIRKALPKYLKLDESLTLLESVDGPNAVRDYCILTLFLNCGLRISELVGLNKTDVRGDQLRVLGKGNKERILYLNDACQRALDDWMIERNSLTLIDENALFVTPKYRKRIRQRFRLHLPARKLPLLTNGNRLCKLLIPNHNPKHPLPKRIRGRMACVPKRKGRGL